MKNRPNLRWKEVAWKTWKRDASARLRHKEEELEARICTILMTALLVEEAAGEENDVGPVPAQGGDPNSEWQSVSTGKIPTFVH